jgi:hypothetical protein
MRYAYVFGIEMPLMIVQYLDNANIQRVELLSLVCSKHLVYVLGHVILRLGTERP